MRRCLLALSLLTFSTRIWADDLPASKEIRVQPSRVRLVGPERSSQLVVTGVAANGREVDVTGDARYEVADDKVVRVTATGRIVPIASGSTNVTVRVGDQSLVVPVNTMSIEENLPINFATQVVPIFSKHGCNGGGCHGKSGGQNGFALSLLGFVPELDFRTLVKENRGRRLFPASPDDSLLLLKATGAIAHAGGKRLDRDSDEYRVIRRWIASGMPFGDADDPVATKLEVFPESRLATRSSRQQLAVYATFSDGTVVDVTSRAQYESNDPELLEVNRTGLVRVLESSGDATVMARFLGQVAVFRATVPLGVKIPEYAFEHRTIVDKHVHQKFQELGIVPSELCTDEQFIRRASIDITGTLPSPAKVKAFLDDRDPAKRAKFVDSLLETPEYGYYFANLWADLVRLKRANQAKRTFGNFAFHDWIRNAIRTDKPYDRFAREILLASGDEGRNPPVVWYRDLTKPDLVVVDACQLFLGIRIACAECHHHPYEKWSQDDYWNMAAFFGQLGRKTVGARDVVYDKEEGIVINPRTKQAATPRPLGGDEVRLKDGVDPRELLADWMVDGKNPYFARAVVNRYWAHFMRRGLIHPLDDVRATNPPSNPKLLDALARDFVDHKYSLKHLVRTICNSRTYQLGSQPNEFNKHDKTAYARFYPRTMKAEVFFDAVEAVTENRSPIPSLPTDKYAPTRAIMMPDEAIQSTFLDLFGRPQRTSACECERVTEANMAQSLLMINSNDIQSKLARTGGRAERLAKDPRPDAEKVEELFLHALGRRPTQAQLDLALQRIEAGGRDKRLAYENVIWALLNTKEFRLVQ